MPIAYPLKSNAPLQKGDTIAIISTARKVTIEEISFGIQWVKNLGFKVLLGKTIGLTHHQFAGTDIERATDLQAMIDMPEVKAIWCARGGYGTVRIIDQIDFSALLQNSKWIIGYSDITVLHSHLHNLNIETIHAPMAFDIEKASVKAQTALANILLKKENTITFPTAASSQKEQATGVAIGGNLSILYSLCGSKSAIETKGKILFLEDLDEYLYHIDRMLQNLDRNGVFKNLAGLVIGSMTGMHDNTVPFGSTVKELILEITSAYNYPVIFEAPFGHISDNRAIVFGRKIELTVQDDICTLKACDII